MTAPTHGFANQLQTQWLEAQEDPGVHQGAGVDGEEFHDGDLI
jgi:hypothetical protein